MRGACRSGNEAWWATCSDLLDAAQKAGRMRRAILEQADCGTRHVGAHPVALRERDLFRFSALRAFGTWCRLPLPAMKGRRLARFAELALRALDDHAACSCLSDNIIRCTRAVGLRALMTWRWSRPARASCRDPVHVRRVLGWYFIRNITDGAYRMSLAITPSGRARSGTLAWVISNLAVPGPGPAWPLQKRGRAYRACAPV